MGLSRNWSIEAVTHALQKVVSGETKRLIINIPPRNLKSICASVALPAFLLGHNPTRKIICVSYSDDLTAKFSNDCRAVMRSDWYQQTFPRARIDKAKDTEAEGRIRHADFAMGCGEMSEAEFRSFLEAVFGQLAANTIDGSIHQICMDWRHIPEMLAAGHAVYSELKNLCVWNKNNAGMGTFYRSKHELVFVWKSGTAPHINTFELGQYGRSRSNVWDYPGVNSLKPGRLDELAMHPTVKPVALVADAIKDCSRRSGLVLDPFAGSGTVLIAAERTGRRARALEIDPHYVDVAVRRWEGYSGRAAVLAGTESTFEEIGEQRASGHVAALIGSGGCNVEHGK